MRAGVNKRGGGTSEATRGTGPRDDEGPQQTGRVGQYHVGRCVARGTELGDAYLAHNVRTGNPSFVFRPTDEHLDGNSPCAWSARVGSAQGRATFEVLSATAPVSVSAAELCEEMAVTMRDVSGVLESLLRSPNVLDHLLTPPPSRLKRWWLRTKRRTTQLVSRHGKNAALGLLAGGYVLGGGYLGASYLLTTRRDAPPPQPGQHLALALPAPEQEEAALTSGIAKAALESPETGVYDVGGIVPAPMMLARDMPAGPFKNHKRPPCRGSQKDINGGCWIATEEKPDCPDDQFEHKGKCWVPVLVPPNGATGEPRSISR